MLIDWRSWMLCAIARRLGFERQRVGLNDTTGDRAFIFGSTESASRELARNLTILDVQQTAALNAMLEIYDPNRFKKAEPWPGVQ